MLLWRPPYLMFRIQFFRISFLFSRYLFRKKKIFSCLPHQLQLHGIFFYLCQPENCDIYNNNNMYVYIICIFFTISKEKIVNLNLFRDFIFRLINLILIACPPVLFIMIMTAHFDKLFVYLI